MKRLKLFIPLAVFLILGILLAVGLRLDPNELPSLVIDKPVPEFSLPSLDDPNEMITPETLKGEPYIINVWATWCPTCKVEHPFLLKIAEMGIPILGVDYKDDADAAKQLLKKTGNPYVKVAFDDEGALVMPLGVYGAPESFIVDAEGIIRYKLVGAVTEKVWTEEMAQYFFK